MHVVDHPQRQQHLGAAALRHDRPARSFVAPHRRIAVQPHDEHVAALAGLVENMQVTVVENVEASIDGHDSLAFCAQRGGQLRKRTARHETKRIGVVENLLRRDGCRAELPDDDAGRLVGERHGGRVIGAGGACERERRHHGVAGAAHVEHFARERRHRELFVAGPAAERDPVRAQRQHDVCAELGGERPSND